MTPKFIVKAVTISCLVLLTLLVLECSAEEIKFTLYPNGQHKTEEHYKNGKLNGVFKQFYKNGNLQLERKYTNNILEGESKEYYPNGKLKEEIFYHNGKIQHLHLYTIEGKPIKTTSPKKQ